MKILRNFRKIWKQTVIVIAAMLLVTQGAALAYENLMVGGGSLWKTGTSPAIQPLNATDELGDASNRIANGYFTELDVLTLTSATLTVSGVVAADLLPSAADTYDIGSSALAWKDIYASGTVRAGKTGGAADDRVQLLHDGTHGHLDSDSGFVVIDGAIGVSLRDNGTTALQARAGSGKSDITTQAGSYFAFGAGSTNHSLTDAEDVQIAGKLEVDGAMFVDSTMTYGSTITQNSAVTYLIGNTATTQGAFVHDITNDAVMFSAGNDDNKIIITQLEDRFTDFSHGAQTNPTLFVQGSDAATPADYVKIFHDQTNAHIDSGTGFVVLDGAGGVSLRHNGTTAMTFTTDNTKATMIGQAGDYLRIGDAGVTSHSLASEDDLLVTGKFEVDGVTYFDTTTNFAGTIAPAVNVKISASPSLYGSLQVRNASQTSNSMMLLTGSTLNGIVIAEDADATFDFAHGAQPDPTLFFQSNNQETDEWGSIGFASSSQAFMITSGLGATVVSSTAATSTLRVGSSTKPGCLVIGDNDSAGLTYISALNGVLTASTSSCE